MPKRLQANHASLIDQARRQGWDDAVAALMEHVGPSTLADLMTMREVVRAHVRGERGCFKDATFGRYEDTLERTEAGLRALMDDALGGGRDA